VGTAAFGRPVEQSSSAVASEISKILLRTTVIPTLRKTRKDGALGMKPYNNWRLPERTRFLQRKDSTDIAVRFFPLYSYRIPRHFRSNSYSTTPPAVATFSDFF
jgi:hypothetical protein